MYILFENPGGFIKKGSAILMFLELIGAVITYFYLISVDEGLAFLILLLPVAFFFINIYKYVFLWLWSVGRKQWFISLQ